MRDSYHGLLLLLLLLLVRFCLQPLLLLLFLLFDDIWQHGTNRSRRLNTPLNRVRREKRRRGRERVSERVREGSKQKQINEILRKRERLREKEREREREREKENERIDHRFVMIILMMLPICSKSMLLTLPSLLPLLAFPRPPHPFARVIPNPGECKLVSASCPGVKVELRKKKITTTRQHSRSLRDVCGTFGDLGH